MNIFDTLVQEALENKPDFAPLKIVVEKELIHHDILKILSDNDLLVDLTFIGGTCLRTCYGGVRLSEDLDFTGGSNFSRSTLSEMGKIIIENLHKKYGLVVQVSEPIKDKKNVDTWKIKIETRAEKKHLPAQKINIDICAVQSYERVPIMLLNPYGVDMGTDGLVIQAESCEEIYVDKLLAIALRPNRIKYRDIWDIIWLYRKNIQPKFFLILDKLKERGLTKDHFQKLFNARIVSLQHNIITSNEEFRQEMERFLPATSVKKMIDQADFWTFVIQLLTEFSDKIASL